jgi:hypothetical protein
MMSPMKSTFLKVIALIPMTSTPTLPAPSRLKHLPQILLPLWMAATLPAIALEPPPSGQNLRLDAPIQNWDDAIPLGNGLMGGLLWGEKHTLRMSLDRGDLWDERTHGEAEWWKKNTWKNAASKGDPWNDYYNGVTPTKLPGGRLEITLSPEKSASSFELNPRVTVACYYFGNYHPNDPRNEKAKGPGWSEWELVKAARPRFPGHHQPNVPLWGYTDESDPKMMEQKIDAAADHGVDAFIFDWYYPFMNTIGGNTPERFKEALALTKQRLMSRHPNERILNINCWNEWTEGSYLEPDTVHGMKYLEAVYEVFGTGTPSIK